MKKILLLFFFTTRLFSQNEPQLQWAFKQASPIVGGSVITIASTRDSFGNLYFLGTFSNTADFDPSGAVANVTSVASTDMFIAKYTPNGDYVWAKNITGTGNITPRAIEIGDNSVFFTGTYTNTLDINASTATSVNLVSNGETDIFMAKYDFNGNFLAGKSVGGTVADDVTDLKFNSNQIFIAGTFRDTVDFDPAAGTIFNLTSTGTSTDGFFAKYTTGLDFTNAFSISGAGTENLSSLSFNSFGDLYITGNTSGTTDFDPSPSFTNIAIPSGRISFIAKYANEGGFLWVKNIGGRTTGTIYPSKIVVGSDNSLYVSGQFNLSSDFDPSTANVTLAPEGLDVFIAKYDIDGNYAWAGKIGGPPVDTFTSLVLDDSNNLYLTGAFTGVVDFDISAGTVSIDSANGAGFFAKYSSAGVLSYAFNTETTGTKVLFDSTTNSIILSGTFSGYRDVDVSANSTFLYADIINSFFTKYTVNGSYLYAKQLGNYPTSVGVNFVGTDADGAVYRAGNYGGTLDLDPSAATSEVTSVGWTDSYLAKYSSTGTLLWTKSIGGNLFSGISAMNTDPNGNTYIMGRFFGTVDFDPSANVANLVSTSNTLSETFIAKYDANGNYVWAKKFTSSFAVSDIKFDTLGNIYYLARFSGTVDVDPSPTSQINYTALGTVDIVFSKFNPQGDLVWAKAIQSIDVFGAINETHLFVNSNAVLISGFFSGDIDFNPSSTEVALLSTQGLDGCLAKYDLNGEYLSANQFVSTINNIVTNAMTDSNNNTIVVTLLEGDADFDFSSGTTVLSSASGINIAIAKYSPSGSLVWAKVTQGVDADGGNNFNFRDTQAFIDANDSIIINGVFFGNYDFDPSNGVTNLSSTYNTSTQNYRGNVFVAKFNSAGDFVTANKFDGNHAAIVTSAVLANNQDLLFTGAFIGTADFDFTSNVQNLTSSSSTYEDRFFARYSVGTLDLVENTLERNSFVVYPNPTANNLNIYHPSLSNFDVTITDISGKVLLQKNNTNETLVNVADYPQGLYFITLTNRQDHSTTTLKFIKE